MSEYIVISGKLKKSNTRIILSTFESGSEFYDLLSEYGLYEDSIRVDRLFVLEVLEDVRKIINGYEVMMDGFKTSVKNQYSIDDYTKLVKRMRKFKEAESVLKFIRDIVNEISCNQYETLGEFEHFEYLEISKR